MTEENKALYRRFVEEVFNDKDLSVIDELVAEDFTEHSQPPPGVPPGAEGLKRIFASYFRAFPDLHVATDLLIAEDDLVAAYHTVTCTHTGDFIGIPATGKPLSVEEAHISPLRRRQSGGALGADGHDEHDAAAGSAPRS